MPQPRIEIEPPRSTPAPPRQTPRRRLVGARRAARVLALATLMAWSSGQSEWQVDVLIPDTISVRMPAPEIAFGITHDDYPPAAFPARYPATVPDGGVFPLEVFSSAEGGWSLLLEIPDMVDDTGQGVVWAEQILYRVNDGVWSRGSPVPQVIYSAAGPTSDWLRLEIEFQLELVGTERPGSFSVTTQLTALSDGQAP